VSAKRLARRRSARRQNLKNHLPVAKKHTAS
jgi:hypothetical protein